MKRSKNNEVKHYYSGIKRRTADFSLTPQCGSFDYTMPPKGIKFLLGAPYPRGKPTGYYGRACTPFQGGRKNWNTSCHGMTRSAVFLQPRQAAGY